MGLKIQKGSVKGQLASANGALSEALSSCAAAKTAIDAYQNNSNLQGISYDSMREQYNRHLILLDGMISYIDDMLDGNRSYELQMNSTLNELTYYDEDDLRQQLNRIRIQMRRIEDHLSALMPILQMMERRVMRLLESLYQFEGSTGNIYTGAQNTWQLLQAAMNQMDQIQFDAVSGVFVVPVSGDLDAFGALDHYNRQKKAAGYKCIEVTAEGAAVRGLSDCCLFGGDPINLSTGNFIYQKEDLKISGATPLSFARFYNSQDEREGSLSRGWVHNYECRLEHAEDQIRVSYEDGHEELFVRMEPDLYVNGTNGIGRIEVLHTDGKMTYLYERKDHTKQLFDENGQEMRREYTSGAPLVFVYNEKGQLVKAETEGSHLKYKYSEAGKLTQVTDHTGRMVQLTYESGTLSSVRNTLGEQLNYGYDSDKRLVKVQNPRGINTIENEYDKEHRVIRQVLADGGEILLDYQAEKQVVMTEQNGRKTTNYYDEKYRTIKTADAGGEERFAYNEQNQRIAVIDKRGNKTEYSYDTLGNLTEERSPLGRKLQYTYNAKNRLTKLECNEVIKLEQSYNEAGHVSEIKNALGYKQLFSYNEVGLPVELIQADGSKMTFAYDPKGNLISVTNGAGHTIKYRYDALNRVVEVEDGKGEVTHYKYDSNHNLIAVQNAQGRERTYTYNESGKVTSMTDFDGSITRQEYGLLSKPEKIIDPLGNETCYEYDLMRNVKKEINPLGGEVSYAYDLWNRVTSVEKSTGGITRYEYDEVGNCTKIISANGNETKMEYDQENRLIKRILPNKSEITYTYDPEGRLLHTAHSEGLETSYVYDEAGQLLKESSTGREITYTYTPLGQIETVTDGVKVTSYTYGAGGILDKVSDSEGRWESYTYDANQNLIHRENESGIIFKYTYDCLNRIIQIENKEGSNKRYEYDWSGRVTAMIDGKENRTEYRYDQAGNLIQVTDALGNETAYTYDGLGNLLTIRQEEELELQLDSDWQEAATRNQEAKKIHRTVYERNVFGQLEAITDALGQREYFQYDLEGNLVRKTDRDGYVTNYDYDVMNQVNKISYADGKTVRLQYDGLAQLKEFEDWLGITRIETDETGRVVEVTDPKGQKVGYQWGKQGERKAVIYPDGSAVTYRYDEHLRLVETANQNVQVSYEYDKLGRLVQKEFSSGQKTQYQYHKNGQLAELSHWNQEQLMDRFRYQYDSLGNKEQIQKERHGLAEEQGIYQYGYDALNRLHEVKKDEEVIRKYEYDGFGNRIFMFDQGKEKRYTYNELNQLLVKTELEGNQRTGSQVSEETYQYDKRGNLTEIYKDGTLINQYHFGVLNRLESAMNYKTGFGAMYTYDGLGNRIGKVEGTPVEPLLPDAKLTGMNLNPTKRIEDVLDRTKQYHNLLQRHEGEKVTSFTWDHNVLSATDADETYHYFQDDLGSPIRLLDGTGEKQESYGYDEFGQELYGNQKVVQPFGFTGYQKDQVTGTYFAQAREYQAEQGRFVGEDIVKGNGMYPFTLNPYIYCWNQPLSLVDLDGRKPFGYEVLHTEKVADYPLFALENEVYTEYAGDIVSGSISNQGIGITIKTPELEIGDMSIHLEYDVSGGIKIQSKNNKTNEYNEVGAQFESVRSWAFTYTTGKERETGPEVVSGDSTTFSISPNNKGTGLFSSIAWSLISLWDTEPYSDPSVAPNTADESDWDKVKRFLQNKFDIKEKNACEE